MALATRPLGTSGMEITKVGFGSWAIGGGGWSFGWGPQDDAESLETMRHAIELGINWIDTAAVYGLGHSEQLVERLLRELPAKRAEAGIDPPRMRGLARAARSGAHRSVSVSLARRDGHADRGFVG